MSPLAARALADAEQVTNLILSLAIVAVCLFAWRRWKAARGWLVGPLSYGVHSAVFHVAILGHWVVSPYTSLWSAALRLHSHLFVLGTIVILIIAALDEYDRVVSEGALDD